jgi:hypothetical protein
MTYSKLFIGSLAFMGVFACSTAPKVDLPSGSDPQAKIAETSARLNGDQAKQYDLLSPGHFSDAQKDLAEARKQSEKGEPSEEILADIGRSMAQLQIVEDNGLKGPTRRWQTPIKLFLPNSRQRITN